MVATKSTLANPKGFMRTLCLSCAFVALAFTAPSAQSPPRPNVVIFIMDDLGYGDIGSYGAPDVKTPNIDRLAREGVKLTDFYANHANCSPTRTGFITGRYQQRYGIESPLRGTTTRVNCCLRIHHSHGC